MIRSLIYQDVEFQQHYYSNQFHLIVLKNQIEILHITETLLIEIEEKQEILINGLKNDINI